MERKIIELLQSKDLQVISPNKFIWGNMPMTFLQLFNSLSLKELSKFGVLNEWIELSLAEQKELVMASIHRVQEKEIARKARQREKELERQAFIPDRNLDNYINLIDYTTGKEFVYNLKLSKVSEMDSEGYLRIARKNAVRKFAVVDYYPMDERQNWLGEIEEEEIFFVNRHVYPEWRKVERDGSCPELIDRFLKHLFPDETCREYCLNWVRNALTEERNGTYLVLNAAKGVGKNLFVNIVKELVGQHNYNKANRSFLDKEFNSILEHCRLILIDEQQLNTSQIIDQVKDFINCDQNIERKGVDAKRTIKTYNNFIVCNNRETDIKLDQDDRRFSVMDMTKIPLNKVMTDEEINFIDKIEFYPEMIADFGWYVLNHCKSDKWGIETPYKGEHFYHLVKTSLFEWQVFIMDTLLSGKEKRYTLPNLNREYKVKRSSTASSFTRAKLSEFVNSYLYEGKKLGKVYKSQGEWYLVPDENLIEVEKCDNEIDESLEDIL